MPAAPSAAVSPESATRRGAPARGSLRCRLRSSCARKPVRNVTARPSVPHARRAAPTIARTPQKAANHRHHGKSRSESDNALPPFSRTWQLSARCPPRCSGRPVFSGIPHPAEPAGPAGSLPRTGTGRTPTAHRGFSVIRACRCAVARAGPACLTPERTGACPPRQVASVRGPVLRPPRCVTKPPRVAVLAGGSPGGDGLEELEGQRRGLREGADDRVGPGFVRCRGVLALPDPDGAGYDGERDGDVLGRTVAV